MSKIRNFIEREKIKELINRLDQADETLFETYLQISTEENDEEITKIRDFIQASINTLGDRLREFEKAQL
jgi:hypothetical protein